MGHIIGTGSLLIVLTVFVHSAATRTVIALVNRKAGKDTPFRRTVYIDAVILLLVLATLVEGGIWAVAYRLNGSFAHFEEALYFSLVTYATLGYGDIVIEGPHRLLSGLEAVTGVIMLGWSTALVVIVIREVFFSGSGPAD